ncbi:Arrestin-related trafficking adapter 3 [Yarrowia sp. C11]|nr:Arrestin-related trafficking adapter 3 [Yarrowia sp. C11]KAG5363914.1 Arrestin-related trafficking adapter 3 [Yarrowia sp. E02]
MPSLKTPHTTTAVENSPLFPAHFSHEAKDISSSGSVSIGIVLAEKNLFVHGFDHHEQEQQPPALLRGSLIVKVSKSTKIKSINLSFRGIARTEWPEGIPPKKVDTFEQKDLHSHVWPFFNSSFPMAEYSSGAHIVRSNHLHDHPLTRTSTHGSSTSLHEMDESHDEDDHHETHIIKGLANKLRRAASPSPVFRNRSKSPSRASKEMSSSRSDSVDLPRTNTSSSTTSTTSEPTEKDVHTKGYRLFPPGEYVYNFELPIQASLPETISAAFGSVSYTLEASIERPGAFRSNLVGKKEVRLIRAPADQSQEVTEPIVISRHWEDQLHYDIVIGGKSLPIGTKMQVAFKLTPLAKVKCHRIRIYISENIDYYCRKMKIHRVEPARKYLVFEHKPDGGIQESLLPNLDGVQELMAGGATELEFDVVMPEKVGRDKKERLHPNTSFKNIKVHHWIKVVMRLSKIDPENPEKRKHFEISIDSPFHLLDSRCTGANVSLPAYPAGRRPSRPISVVSSDVPRPIHFIRQPSIAPPPFDADEAPPQLAEPPSYDSADGGTYQERFSQYQRSRGRQASQISLTPSTAPSMDLSTSRDFGSFNPRESSAALLRRASQTSVNVLATTPPATSHIGGRHASVASSSSSVDITNQGGGGMFRNYDMGRATEAAVREAPEHDDDHDEHGDPDDPLAPSRDPTHSNDVTPLENSDSDSASHLTASPSSTSLASSYYQRRLETGSICSDRLLDDDGVGDNVHDLAANLAASASRLSLGDL